MVRVRGISQYILFQKCLDNWLYGECTDRNILANFLRIVIYPALVKFGHSEKRTKFEGCQGCDLGIRGCPLNNVG
jgi:hypothetical protein